jgi:gp32 DNA binding protein like
MSVVNARTQRLAALRSKMEESSGSKSTTQRDDDRYWKAEKDVAGNGSAIIRFLPAKKGEEFPYVQLHTHGFQGPTSKWFIDNCPTTIGEDCPVCKANGILWNSGNEADKKLASSRKRKLNYISNILVVNDPKHPENNGKVFLFKYGKKIFDKLKEMVNPPEDPLATTQEPIDPFDPEFGANFKLRITKQDGFPNYDRSTFDTNVTEIGSEDFITEIKNQLMSLNELVDPAQFKPYATLKQRFDMVTGESSGDDEEVSKPELAESKPATKATATTKPKATTAAATVKTPADDSDDFFANLAKQSDGQ